MFIEGTNIAKLTTIQKRRTCSFNKSSEICRILLIKCKLLTKKERLPQLDDHIETNEELIQ